MSEYTPTTAEIREYIETGGEYAPWEPPNPALETARVEAFNRWLASERRRVWHEGFCVGERSGAREDPLNPYTENPYRERGERDD